MTCNVYGSDLKVGWDGGESKDEIVNKLLLLLLLLLLLQERRHAMACHTMSNAISRRRKRTSPHLYAPFSSVIQAVLGASITESIAISSSLIGLLFGREAEEIATTGILHALSERFVSSDLDVADGSSGQLHGFFEMGLGELWDRIFGISIFLHLDIFASSLALFGLLNVDGDGLLDGELDRSLGDETEIGTGEAVCLAGNVLDIDIVGHGRLAKLCFQDSNTRCFVGQRHVDKSVKTTRSAKSIVKLFRSIGRANDKDVLLRGHTVHF